MIEIRPSDDDQSGDCTQSGARHVADGKLTREAFDGELEGDVYWQIVDQAQRSLAWPNVCPKIGSRLMLGRH